MITPTNEISNKVSKKITEKLKKNFLIEHTTFEIECLHAGRKP